MSADTNMFINGKLDNSILSFVCAKLVSKQSLNGMALRRWNCPATCISLICGFQFLDSVLGLPTIKNGSHKNIIVAVVGISKH